MSDDKYECPDQNESESVKHNIQSMRSYTHGQVEEIMIVEGQEHGPIESRYFSGFFVLRNQVLVLL
jgi:hypothetical protein